MNPPYSSLNWLGRATEDQRRIEGVLLKMVTPSSKVLHVGIGDSGLAQRFIQRVSLIEGITVGPDELTHALALQLPRYSVYLVDKYDERLPKILRDGPYDFIVDNNLVSYATDKDQFRKMMWTYRELLKVKGRLLTDLAGWQHTPFHDWNLSLYVESGRAGLNPVAEDSLTFSLVREAA